MTIPICEFLNTLLIHNLDVISLLVKFMAHYVSECALNILLIVRLLRGMLSLLNIIIINENLELIEILILVGNRIFLRYTH